MLPEEVAGYLEQKSPAITFEVERGAIRRYADAVGETNLLYWEEEEGILMAPLGMGISSVRIGTS